MKQNKIIIIIFTLSSLKVGQLIAGMTFSSAELDTPRAVEIAMMVIIGPLLQQTADVNPEQL